MNDRGVGGGVGILLIMIVLFAGVVGAEWNHTRLNLDDANRQLQDQVDQIAGLEANLAEKEVEIARLQGELDEARGQVSEMPDLKQQVKKLQELAAARQADLTQKTAEIARLEGELGAARTAGQGAEKQAGVLQLENNQVKIAYADLQAENGQLKAELEKLNQSPFACISGGAQASGINCLVSLFTTANPRDMVSLVVILSILGMIASFASFTVIRLGRQVGRSASPAEFVQVRIPRSRIAEVVALLRKKQ